MYSKKAFLILGLFMVLLISFEVSARDLTGTSSKTKKDVFDEQRNEVIDVKIVCCGCDVVPPGGHRWCHSCC
ncbi:unnamed protein product [Trifolium pratense]|uniref:Uncharacterized protein n=1 Tax=Trifolium pratense TaxID=57577 RepID=A0ACB0IQ79_TRIPR|nr:unnamed protein product [Trifolium pratense]